MRIISKFYPILIILLVSIFAVMPLLNNGFFPMHDDTQVTRIYEMAKTLRLFNFPVRVVPDLGYGLGYPIFNYYAPLAYYFGSIFVLLGQNALIATKITMILGMILAGIFMYLLAKEIFGKVPAIVSSLFYVFAPYHALDLFVRGDLAELFGYAFVPLVFYGLVKIYKKKSVASIIITSIGFASVILSHNLTAFMLTPFLIAAILILSFVLNKKNNLLMLVCMISSLTLGLILSFFYWFPALFELKNTNVASIISGSSFYFDHFVCLNQLWSSSWGFGGSTKGCIDGLSFMIGKLHIIFALISGSLAFLYLLFKKKAKNNKTISVIFFVFIGFLTTVFLTQLESNLIWSKIYIMTFLQFPWRFLLIASFFASILSGGFIYLISLIIFKKYATYFTIFISIFIIICLVFLNIKFFIPQKIITVDSNYYTSDYALKWRVSKISDEYLPRNINKPKTAKVALQNTQIIGFNQTPIELISNYVSLAGILALILGIITVKFKYEKTS